MKFPGVEQLKRQVTRDIEAARARFSGGTFG